jgi:hypothetical protein
MTDDTWQAGRSWQAYIVRQEVHCKKTANLIYCLPKPASYTVKKVSGFLQCSGQVLTGRNWQAGIGRQELSGRHWQAGADRQEMRRQELVR